MNETIVVGFFCTLAVHSNQNYYIRNGSTFNVSLLPVKGVTCLCEQVSTRHQLLKR